MKLKIATIKIKTMFNGYKEFECKKYTNNVEKDEIKYSEIIVEENIPTFRNRNITF